MADNLTPFDPSSAPTAAAPQAGLRGFLNSKSGKLIIGFALLVVVVGVLGIIAFGFLGSSGTNEVATPSGSQSGSSVAKQPTEVIAVKVPADVDLDNVFTYRDVFVPTIVLVSTTTSSTSNTANTSTTTSSTTSNSNTPANTLVLEDITTEDGQPVAVLGWNGETYSLNEGESIPGTPWQVLEINSSTVVMLYGDQRVTLSVGVGISK